MGTVVVVTVAHGDEALAKAGIEAVFEEFERVDSLLSSYDTESAVSKINRGAYEKRVPVGSELFELLNASMEFNRASGGAFDITVGPLTELWGFDRGGVVPPEAAVQSALRSVGSAGLSLDPERHEVGFMEPGMKLDFGGIGKGYAADLAAVRLQEMGIENAIIDAGGDLKLLGSRPGKDHWKIGIRHPREAARLLLSLELKDTAVVTSGDYERFFMEGGVRYHHILDPRTGYPARGSQSVTVIYPAARDADAYATAAFVMGPEAGLEYLRSIQGVEGIIVDSEGNVRWTTASGHRR